MNPGSDVVSGCTPTPRQAATREPVTLSAPDDLAPAGAVQTYGCGVGLGVRVGARSPVPV